jgi:adenosylhomocysteine nucleosidase
MRTRTAAVALGAILVAAAPGMAFNPARNGICSTVASRKGTRALAIFSAFPAELAPLVARTTSLARVEVDGHPFYTGELAGVRVVLGLTGIGMVNAANSAETLLAGFDVAAVLFSGVAGSAHVIGDVVVPTQWIETATGSVFPVNVALFELVHRVPSTVSLERCTNVPPPDGASTCILEQPEMLVGGTGHSGDSFGGAFHCTPGAGEIFGCDLPEPAATTSTTDQPPDQPPDEPIDELIAEDMETAAVAKVAAAHDVPFLGFRGVSDGAGDPLGLPGFPSQFFAYYRLAAVNAAAGATGLLDQIALLGGRSSGSPVCRFLARERWEQAARRLRSKAGRHR